MLHQNAHRQQRHRAALQSWRRATVKSWCRATFWPCNRGLWCRAALNPGTVPPSNPGTVPPSGSFNQPPRRNNTVLWVVIGILSAIILIGATWFIATKVLGDDSKSSDNSEDSIGSDVEVVDYETDDTPTQSDTYDADTLAEPDVEEVYNTDDASNSHSSSTSSDDNTNVITGYLHHSDGDKSCYVRLVFTVDNDSEVSGTVSFNNTTLDISGNYYDGSKKLLIYENGAAAMKATSTAAPTLANITTTTAHGRSA